MALTTGQVIQGCIEPWHNYKEQMRYDTELRVRPDGTIVPIVSVGRFQDIINECSRKLISELGFSDYNLLSSLIEVAANAKAMQDLEAVKRGQIRGA